jgi:hypothetical protein
MAAVPIKATGLTFGIVLLLWLLLAAVVSKAGLLDSVPSPVLFILGAVLPASAYFAAYFGSVRFRKLVLSLDVRAVTLVQASRITGFIFFMEYIWGRLPGPFAIPTGLTDMTVGITSAIVVSRLSNRGLFSWHIFGMVAELCSGAMGVFTSGTPLGWLATGVTSQAMSTFPLNLVPIYLGPVTLIFHLIALCALRHRAAH